VTKARAGAALRARWATSPDRHCWRYRPAAACRHTDSAEETIVIVDGKASVTVGDEQGEVPAGGVALVPECVPHEVRNEGNGPLRFVALYAGIDVTTTYEQPIQPSGDRESQPLG